MRIFSFTSLGLIVTACLKSQSVNCSTPVSQNWSALMVFSLEDSSCFLIYLNVEQYCIVSSTLWEMLQKFLVLLCSFEKYRFFKNIRLIPWLSSNGKFLFPLQQAVAQISIHFFRPCDYLPSESYKNRNFTQCHSVLISTVSTPFSAYFCSLSRIFSWLFLYLVQSLQL